MSYITPEALKFLEEAKQGFDNLERTTYRNEKEGFIALRTGFMEDGLEIFELGKKVGFFTEQLKRQHTVIVDYDELNRLKKLEQEYKKIYKFLKHVDNNDDFSQIKGILLHCTEISKSE